MATSRDAAPSNRRPGRPRADDGPAVDRDDIVEAALADLARGGYAALSLRSLARSLGVSLGAVQYHFATKDDLWRAAADAVAPAIGDRESAGTDAPEDRLAGQILRQVERSSSRPGLSAALWNDEADGAADRLAYLGDKVRPYLEASRAEIGAGIEAGTVRRVDPDVLVMLVSLGIGSLASAPEALRQLFDVDIDDPDARAALAAGLADLLMFGLLERPEGVTS